MINKALREIQEVQSDLLSRASFDHLSFACIDFQSQQVHSWNLDNKSVQNQPKIFDLSSLTKPLLLASYYLKYKESFNDSMLGLLEHRVDLPAFGRISHTNWREVINSYSLNLLNSGYRYSDYSSLRLMLEIGQDRLKSYYLSELNTKHKIKNWQDLDYEQVHLCAPTGYRDGCTIRGQVHDPNAYTIDEFTSHSGLFGSVNNIAHYLLALDSNDQLLMTQSSRAKFQKNRAYYQGWDGVQNQESTLAGQMESSLGNHDNTFGFLGFTGTSIWINPELQTGWVLLTNATQEYWYDRTLLNEIRRKTGQLVWPLFR